MGKKRKFKPSIPNQLIKQIHNAPDAIDTVNKLNSKLNKLVVQQSTKSHSQYSNLWSTCLNCYTMQKHIFKTTFTDPYRQYKPCRNCGFEYSITNIHMWDAEELQKFRDHLMGGIQLDVTT